LSHLTPCSADETGTTGQSKDVSVADNRDGVANTSAASTLREIWAIYSIAIMIEESTRPTKHESTEMAMPTTQISTGDLAIQFMSIPTFVRYDVEAAHDDAPATIHACTPTKSFQAEGIRPKVQNARVITTRSCERAGVTRTLE
jgi:hypothetical protein